MIIGLILGSLHSFSAWMFTATAGIFLYVALGDMMPELSSGHSHAISPNKQKEAHWLGSSLERERDGRIRAVLGEGQAIHRHRQADLFLEDVVRVIGYRRRRTHDGSLVEEDGIRVTETAKAALELVEGTHGSHIGASFFLIIFFLARG